MARGRLFGLGFLLAVAVLGCGGGSGGSSNGDPKDTRSACDGYCIKYFAASCPSPIYTSMSECGATECDPRAGTPPGCQTPLKVYYDCRRNQADICGDSGCDSEFAALATCH